MGEASARCVTVMRRAMGGIRNGAIGVSDKSGAVSVLCDGGHQSEKIHPLIPADRPQAGPSARDPAIVRRS